MAMPMAPTIMTQNGIAAVLDLPAVHGLGDRRQRPHGIGHVVGAVGEAEQCRGEDQRYGEQGIDAGLGVFQCVGLAGDRAA